MITIPIRWRLTSRFTLILAGIVILSGLLMHILLQRYLLDQTDRGLRVYTEQVHGNFKPGQVSENFSMIHSQIPPINEFVFPGIYLQVIDHQGVVVVKSNNLGAQELPVDPALISNGFAGQADIATVAAGAGASVRIMVTPLYLKDRVLLLEVGQSLHQVDLVMRQVTWAILASVILTLILAALTGAFTVGGALAPVRRVTRIARSIGTSSDLSQRVSYAGPADEIGELANTFDRMIEQLDQAFRSQKHFVADASHELRGPLTVIRGNLDLLNKNLNQADREESMKAIAAETARMTKIVEDLLLVAELDAGPEEMKETVNLRDVLNDSLETGRLTAPGRDIVAGRVEDLAVRGDSYLLKQAMRNLVDNAVRYAGDGSTITLSLFQDGRQACLEVRDNGRGIPAEHLPFIFDRFYRVDKARSRHSGGTGLGLTIVKSIAERHGGTVSVNSEPGQGSVFRILLQI